jgi:hypothetical protein
MGCGDGAREMLRIGHRRPASGTSASSQLLRWRIGAFRSRLTAGEYRCGRRRWHLRWIESVQQGSTVTLWSAIEREVTQARVYSPFMATLSRRGEATPKEAAG